MRGPSRIAALASIFAVLMSAHSSLAQNSSAPDSKSSDRGPQAFLAPHFIFTPHPRLASARDIHASISFEARSHWRAPLSGLEGTLRRFAFLRFDFGVAKNVTLQIRGAVQQQLTIDATRSQPKEGYPSSGTTRDAGDFTVATMIRLYSDKAQKTALGFHIETKLPNTTQSKGIGPNTTDIHLSVLASRQIGPAFFFGDLGIGILTAPRALDEQNDVMRYGVGVSFQATRRVQLAAEINGYLNTRNLIPLGTETRGLARAGAAFSFGKFALEAAWLHGLTKNEGDWGGSVGVARRVSF